jgi:hypothetical protein
MPAIPTFDDIKQLKKFLIKEEKKKVKYTKQEIATAKGKLKNK